MILDCEIQINPLKNSLHRFDGIFRWLKERDEESNILQDPITLENTAWCGCTISHNEIIGVVIAVGKNTRLEKNSKTSKTIKKT